MYVTEERSQNDAYINNQNIQQRNKNIATLADNRNIFYIDVNEVYADGKGNLSKEYTFDNVHLKGACYGQWVTFLMEHGIVKYKEKRPKMMIFGRFFIFCPIIFLYFYGRP